MRYFIIDAYEARKLEYAAPYGEDWDAYFRWNDGYENILYSDDGEGNIRYISTDAGMQDCPEDAYLNRAYSWVVDELTKAYGDGVIAGIKAERNSRTNGTFPG